MDQLSNFPLNLSVRLQISFAKCTGPIKIPYDTRCESLELLEIRVSRYNSRRNVSA